MPVHGFEVTARNSGGNVAVGSWQITDPVNTQLVLGEEDA